MERLTTEPLYKRAETAMIARIVGRVWTPGMRLPNEFDLAAEFGVSQGTIRKALVALENRGLILRSPGRGTIIARTTEHDRSIAFFRLRDKAGQMAVPEPLSESVGRRAATKAERALFDADVTDVHTIERVRQYDGAPFVFEQMRLPVGLCPGLDADAPLPIRSTLIFRKDFGLSIMATEESISATVARAKESRLLNAAAGTPLLRVERRARDLADRVVELRTSLILTDRATYRVDLVRSEPPTAAGDPTGTGREGATVAAPSKPRPTTLYLDASANSSSSSAEHSSTALWAASIHSRPKLSSYHFQTGFAACLNASFSSAVGV